MQWPVFLLALLQLGVWLVSCEMCGNNSFHYYKTGLQPGDIELILDLHNQERQLVASGNCNASTGLLPRACNMTKMVWDDELASWAQLHTNGCEFEHWNPVGTTNEYYGQNLFIKWSNSKEIMETSDWKLSIDYWNNEDAMFDGNNRKPFKFDHPTGHFTQVVWARTYKVGCGATWFVNTTDTEHPYRTLYTCQYWPGGNVIDWPMYETDSCEECRLDTKYPNLCLVKQETSPERENEIQDQVTTVWPMNKENNTERETEIQDQVTTVWPMNKENNTERENEIQDQLTTVWPMNKENSTESDV